MAISASGNPIFKAFDNNGDPLVGGKLYTYAAGTSTPKATYEDYGLLTANTNPVVLDSRGEATVFMSGSYKFILKDSADVTIWTIDYINEAPTISDWTAETNAVLYVDSNTFTVEGDQTATYTVDRAVKLTQTAAAAGNVSASSYSGVTGKTTVDLYTSVVDGGLTAVSYGQDPDADALDGQSATGANTVVRRDASGDFTANEINADLKGTADLTGMDGELKNGSFEVNNDGDTVPDGWTFSTLTGGSGAIVTTPNAHGLNAFSMVHPGGSGNGGGILESDYCACSEYVQEVISFIIWDTASAHNYVQVLFYDSSQSYLSSTNIYDSTTTAATPTLESFIFTPPSTARFLKVRLIGGFTDTDSAGTTYFGLVSKRKRLITDEEITANEIEDNTITQLKIGTDAVGRDELKTTTSTHSYALGATSGYTFTPTGADHTTNYFLGGSNELRICGHATLAFTTTQMGVYNTGAGTNTAYLSTRYVQSSPPYKIGTVTWGHFVFVMRNKSTGEIIGTYEAEDPPWAYNGAIWEPKDSPERIQSMPHPFGNQYDNDGNITRDVNDPAFEIVMIDMRDFNVKDWKMDALKNGKCSVLEDMQGCIPIGKELKHSQFKLPTVTGFTDKVKIRARL